MLGTDVRPSKDLYEWIHALRGIYGASVIFYKNMLNDGEPLSVTVDAFVQGIYVGYYMEDFYTKNMTKCIFGVDEPKELYAEDNQA